MKNHFKKRYDIICLKQKISVYEKTADKKLAEFNFKMVHLKLLLHPIVRVYTCKCAANIVEKYEHSLVVG